MGTDAMGADVGCSVPVSLVLGLPGSWRSLLWGCSPRWALRATVVVFRGRCRHAGGLWFGGLALELCKMEATLGLFTLCSKWLLALSSVRL